MKVTEGLCSFCDHKVAVLETPSLYLKYVQKTFFADPMVLAQVEDTLRNYSVCVVCMYNIIICHKFKQDYEDMQQKKVSGKAAANCCFICHTKLSELFNVSDNPADFELRIGLFWKVVEDHRSLLGCQVCSDCIFSLHTWHKTRSILYSKLEIKEETEPGTRNRMRQSKMGTPQKVMKENLTHLKSVKENPAKKGDWNANVVEDKKFYEQIPYVSLPKRQREKLSRSPESKAKRNKVAEEKASGPSSVRTSRRTGISTKMDATKLQTPTKRAASKVPLSTKKVATTSPSPTKRAASRSPSATKNGATTSSTPTKRAASRSPSATKNAETASSTPAKRAASRTPTSTKNAETASSTPTKRAASRTATATKNAATASSTPTKRAASRTRTSTRKAGTTSPTLAKGAASKSPTLPEKATEQKKGRQRGKKAKSEMPEEVKSLPKSAAPKSVQIVKKKMKIKVSKTFTMTKRTRRSTLKLPTKEHVDITCNICDKHFDLVAAYKSHSLWHEKPEQVTIGLVRRELPRRISVADFLSYNELPDVCVKESHGDTAEEAKEEPSPPTDKEEPQPTTSQEPAEDNIPTADECTIITDSASESNIEQRVAEVTESQPEETAENADTDNQLNDSSNKDCEQDQSANDENNQSSEQVSKDQRNASENETVVIDDESQLDKHGEQKSVRKQQVVTIDLLDDESIDFRLTEDEDLLGKSVEDVTPINDDGNAGAEDAQTDIVEIAEDEEESPEIQHTANQEVEDNTLPEDNDNDTNLDEREASNSNNDADQDGNNEPSGEDEPSNDNRTSNEQNETCDNENQPDFQISISDCTNGMEKEPDIQNDVFMNGTETDDVSENELSWTRKRSADEKENLNTSNSSGDPKTKRVRFALTLEEELAHLDGTDSEDVLDKLCSEYCVADDLLQSKI